MIKRRYVKEIYVDEAICDKCGSLMEKDYHLTKHLPTIEGKVYFICTNKDCLWTTVFPTDNLPGRPVYIFDTEKEIFIEGEKEVEADQEHVEIDLATLQIG